MKFEPIIVRSQQMAAFMQIHEAFSKSQACGEFPLSGVVTDSDTGINWTWSIRPKKRGSKLMLWDFQFKPVNRAELALTIPIDVVGINNRGLVARDEKGQRFLCSQSRTKTRLIHVPGDKKFAHGWSGPDYPSFPVKGESSTRTYFACIPLDEGRLKIQNSFVTLFAGLPKKTRTKKAAKKLMAEHYAANRSAYPAAIKTKRERIIESLMGGKTPEEAFQDAMESAC